MKVTEVLNEAGVMDTLKAVAQQGIISGTDSIRQTANKLASQRSVQQLADQMVKVWNGIVSQERQRLQGAGSDGTIGEQQYKNLLANFITKNIVGQNLNNIKDTNTKQEIGNIIQRIQDNRESPRAFSELFRQVIVMGLIARMQAPDQQDTTSTTTTNAKPQTQAVGNERAAQREIEQALDQLGIKSPMRKQIGGLVSQLGGGQPARRTNNPAVDALLISMGIQLK